MRYICLERNEHGYEEREKHILWEFSDPTVFAGCTFSGSLEVKGVGKEEIKCEWRGDKVLLTFPALYAGRYEFDIMASGEDGEQERVAHGWYGVEKVVTEKSEESESEWVTQKILIPGKLGDALRSRWMSTDTAREYAREARESADEVRHGVELLERSEAVVSELERGVQEAFTIGANEHWYVGSKDTGKPSRGERGMNADDIQYHIISSSALLPNDPEHCNPRHRYVVRSGSTLAGGAPEEWVQYLWISGGWRAFPLYAPLPASVLADGLVRLSTDDVISDGLLIGKNNDGQIVSRLDADIVVPDASVEKAGKVRLAASIDDTELSVSTAKLVKDYVDSQIQATRVALIEYMDMHCMPAGAIQVVDTLPEPQQSGVIYLVREQ